jgi:hypothetical protein
MGQSVGFSWGFVVVWIRASICGEIDWEVSAFLLSLSVLDAFLLIVGLGGGNSYLFEP